MFKNYFFYLFILSYTTLGFCSEKNQYTVSKALGSLHLALKKHTVPQYRIVKTNTDKIQPVKKQDKGENTVLSIVLDLGLDLLLPSDKEVRNLRINKTQTAKNFEKSLRNSLRNLN